MGVHSMATFPFYSKLASPSHGSIQNINGLMPNRMRSKQGDDVLLRLQMFRAITWKCPTCTRPNAEPHGVKRRSLWGHSIANFPLYRKSAARSDGRVQHTPALTRKVKKQHIISPFSELKWDLLVLRPAACPGDRLDRLSTVSYTHLTLPTKRIV